MKKVGVLGAETTDLNLELLQIELAMTAQELEVASQADKSTVYNIIDVAVGSDFESNRVDPD